LHIREEERVAQEASIAGQERAEVLGAGDTAVVKKLYQQRGKA
jgi:hypothetical protein